MGNKTEIAKALKVTRKSLYEWIEKDVFLKEAIQQQEEANIDYAESKLFERIKGYEHKEDKIFQHEGKPVIVPTIKHYPPDPTSIIFFLKTKGKGRGYIERQEIDLNKDINVTIGDKH